MHNQTEQNHNNNNSVDNTNKLLIEYIQAMFKNNKLGKSLDSENLVENLKQLNEANTSEDKKPLAMAWAVYNILSQKEKPSTSEISKSLANFLDTFYACIEGLPHSLFLLLRFGPAHFTSLFIHKTEPETLIIRYLNPFGKLIYNDYDIIIINTISRFIVGKLPDKKVDFETIREDLHNEKLNNGVIIGGFIYYWYTFIQKNGAQATRNDIINFLKKSGNMTTLCQRFNIEQKAVPINQVNGHANTSSQNGIKSEPLPKLIPINNGTFKITNSSVVRTKRKSTSEKHEPKKIKVEDSPKTVNSFSLPILTKNASPVVTKKIEFQNNDNIRLISENTKLLHSTTLAHLEVLSLYSNILETIPAHKAHWESTVVRAEMILNFFINMVNYRSTHLEYKKLKIDVNTYQLDKNDIPPFVNQLTSDINSLVVITDGMFYIHPYVEEEWKQIIDKILVNIQYLEAQLAKIVSSLDNTSSPSKNHQFMNDFGFFGKSVSSPSMSTLPEQMIQLEDEAIVKSIENSNENHFGDIQLPPTPLSLTTTTSTVKTEENDLPVTPISLSETNMYSPTSSITTTSAVKFEENDLPPTPILLPETNMYSPTPSITTTSTLKSEENDLPPTPIALCETNIYAEHSTPIKAPEELLSMNNNNVLTINTDLWYSDSEIQQLLRLKLQDIENVEILAAQFPFVSEQARNLCLDIMKAAIKKAIDNQTISLMPLNTERDLDQKDTTLNNYGLADNAGNHWVGVCIKTNSTKSQDIIIKLIDPQGSVGGYTTIEIDNQREKTFIKVDKNYTFANLIKNFNGSKNRILYPTAEQFVKLICEKLEPMVEEFFEGNRKLKLVITGTVQQNNNDDCGPLVVEDLVAEALGQSIVKTYDTNQLREQHKKLMEENPIQTVTKTTTLSN